MSNLRALMLDHLQTLADDLDVELQFRPATEETIARLHIRERMIELPPIRTRRDYFSGLHEFGHLVVGITGIALYDEATANLWALDHAAVEPTMTVWHQIDGCLADYRWFKGHDPDELHPLMREAWDALEERITVGMEGARGRRR